MDRRPAGRLPAAIGLAAVGVTLAVAFSPRSASTPQADVQVAQIFGLQQDASWLYEIRYGGEKALSYGYKVNRVITEDSRTIYEMVMLGKDKAYLYKGTEKDGLYDYHNRSMLGPGFDVSSPNPQLKTPYQVGTSWSWHAPFRGQTMAGPDGKGLE